MIELRSQRMASKTTAAAAVPSSSVKDIICMSSRLREEHLFVQAEQRNLRTVFSDILSETEQLHKQAWLSWHAKLLGDQFVAPNIFTFALANRSTTTDPLYRNVGSASSAVDNDHARKAAGLPSHNHKNHENDVKKLLCRRYHNIVESCTVVDGARAFSSRVTAYSDVLTKLRREPEQLAELICSEFSTDDSTLQNSADASTYSAAVFHAVHTVLGPLHGFFTFPEDQTLSISFVKRLMQLQFNPKGSPRQIMKHASMPFPCAFKMLVEHLHEAKVFLVTALRAALLDVVANDSLYWDADPLKAMYHFTPEERRDRFGQEGTEHFCQKLAQYQRQVIDNIVRVSRLIIDGIRHSLYCFPANLAALFSDMHVHLSSSFPSHPNLATSICTESLFSYFICSAIVYPEAFTSILGNDDIFISRVARYNLTQIAQVLQTLAISKWESIHLSSSSSILLTILGNFEPEQVWTVLDQILEVGRSFQLVQQQQQQQHNSTTNTQSDEISSNSNVSRRPSATSSSGLMMQMDEAADAAVHVAADATTNLNEPKRAALFMSMAELEILMHAARRLASKSQSLLQKNFVSSVAGGRKTKTNLVDLISRIAFTHNVHTNIIPFAVSQRANRKAPQISAVSSAVAGLRDEVNHIMLREQSKNLHAVLHPNQQQQVTVLILPLSDVHVHHEHDFPGGLSEAEVVGMASRKSIESCSTNDNKRSEPALAANLGRKASLTSLGKASSSASIAPKTIDEHDSIDDEAHSAFSAYSYQSSSVPESSAYQSRTSQPVIIGASTTTVDTLSAVSEELNNSLVDGEQISKNEGAANETVVADEAGGGGGGGGGGGEGRHSRGGSSMEMNAEDAACVAAVMDDADVMDALNGVGDEDHHPHNNQRHHRHHHRRQRGKRMIGDNNGEEDDEVEDEDESEQHLGTISSGGGGRDEARSDAPDDTMSEYYANSVLSGGRTSIDETPGDDADNDDDDDDDDDDVEDARMISPSATVAVLVSNGANTLTGTSNTVRPAEQLGFVDVAGIVAAVPAAAGVPEKFATFADVKENAQNAARDFDARSDAAWSTEVTASDTETAGGSTSEVKALADGGTPSKKRHHHHNHHSRAEEKQDVNDEGEKSGTLIRPNRSTSSSTSSLAVAVGDDAANSASLLSAVLPAAVLSAGSSASAAAKVATTARSAGGLTLRKSTSSSSSSHRTATALSSSTPNPLDDIDSDRWSTGVCLSDSERAGLDDSMADLSLTEQFDNANVATPLGTGSSQERDDADSLIEASQSNMRKVEEESTPPFVDDVATVAAAASAQHPAVERDPFMPYSLAATTPQPAASTPQQPQQPAPILSRTGRHNSRSSSSATAAAAASASALFPNQPFRPQHSVSFSEISEAAYQPSQQQQQQQQQQQMNTNSISSPAKSVSFAHEPLFHHYHQQEEIIFNTSNNSSSTTMTIQQPPVVHNNPSTMTHLQQKFIDETTISTHNSNVPSNVPANGRNSLPNYASNNKTAVSRPVETDGDNDEVVGRSPPKRTRRLSEFSKIFTQTKLRLKNSNTIATALGRAGGRLSEPLHDAPQSAGVWEQQKRPVIMPLNPDRHRIESTDDILTKYRTLPTPIAAQKVAAAAPTTVNDVLIDFADDDEGENMRIGTPVKGATGAGEDAEMRSNSANRAFDANCNRPITPQNAIFEQKQRLVEAGAAEIGPMEESGRRINIADKSSPAVSIAAPELLFEAAKRKLRAAMNSIDVQRASCAPFEYNASLVVQFRTAVAIRHQSSASSIMSDGGDSSSSIFGPFFSEQQQQHSLLTFLRIQLAECMVVGERQQVALLRETIRLIRFLLEATRMRRKRNDSLLSDAATADQKLLSNTETSPIDAEADAACLQSLLDALKTDFYARESYVAYLVRCRQGLLRTRQQLTSLSHRYQCEAQTYSTRFVDFLVENFFISQQHEHELSRFVAVFQQQGSNAVAVDEKVEMLAKFRATLRAALDAELDLDRNSKRFAAPAQRSSYEILQADCDQQTATATICLAQQIHEALDRNLISRVYYDALFPNGEPDRERDEILHNHVVKLRQHVTADHRDLAIKQVFRLDMPWISAQIELSTLGAYKTPRDKIKCVLRTCLALMNLLTSAVELFSSAAMMGGVVASTTTSVAADDFVPALVFVVLQVNPPHLLSTIQYVNAFYADGLLQGEEAYYWTQFSSAVEFIKTMG